jgi:predicted HTH domain antitoxin
MDDLREGGLRHRTGGVPLLGRRERYDEVSAVQMLEVSQDVLDSARITPSELKVEIAVHLYAQGRLSIGKARELAGMALWDFRQLLASRRISPHYDEADLQEDVVTLRELGRR